MAVNIEAGLRWSPLASDDLPAVMRIAAQAHPSLPEREAVFAEKLRLFPPGCRKLSRHDGIIGYGIAHPWTLHDIPPLDDFLRRLPARPDCLYIHDVAMAAEARGHGMLSAYVETVRVAARSLALARLACVSVHSTQPVWRRFGFIEAPRPDLRDKLAGYGAAATYMIADA